MADSIRSRVARIISGNIHSLIDVLENIHPEASMAQAIREVDSIIDEVSTGLGRATASKHLALSNLAEQNRRHKQLAGEIDAAVKELRDDLAKAAIARQLDIEAQIPVVEQAIANTASEEKEMEGYLSALRAKKREMEETLRQFISTRAAQNMPGTSAAGGKSGSQKSAPDKMAQAESTFERILARQTGLPGLLSTTDVQSATKLRELSELARNNRVEERLAALKAKGDGSS
ncbi:MAG: PspA/IM30 family protein [Proteobacteria bacterium]|nr:PspA/IM30 family protein [Cystobacterineae bacterium]MCL2258518.1 PspA/IM30 family protein [Cystobacterineae bacterium]MCL2315253.1 PspA/IM30 family protein [Pseudomonadota bacterium]